MAETKNKKVTTKTSIVNPGYKPGGSAEAVFAPGATITVPTELADKWIGNGSAELAEEVEEAPKKEKK
jgi:hypothetical protein